MTLPGDRSYTFTDDGHWRAGAIRGFATGGGVITVRGTLKAARIDACEAGGLAASGPCGRLVWLDPATGELVVLHECGAEPQGRIATRDAEAIHAGATTLWVREPNLLRRFAARNLQELGTVEVANLVAAAPDGCDGLWLVTHGAHGAKVRWLDRHGRFPQPPIALPDARSPVAIACDFARRQLAVLDVRPGELEWRLHVVDLASCRVCSTLVFSVTDKKLVPAFIAAGDASEFWLASAQAPGVLIAVSPDGIETARQKLVVGADAAITGLIWQDGLVVCTAHGLYRLIPVSGADDAEDGPSAVFVTPTLRSPPATPSGWNRADMTVELPRGARLTATVFSSSSEDIVARFDRYLSDRGIPPAERLAEIDNLFKSSEVEHREEVYKGDGGEQELHLLLDRIPAPFLWLKLEISCPPGSNPAVLRDLRVRYPDRSWLDDLPAIYRDEPGSAAQLRRFLAPFEALLGGIDETIDRLPAQIHPETAPDERLSWLLGWLGFPPTTGLIPAVQRELLTNAGDLLQRRGTVGALRDMLRIVTGHPAVVEDAAVTSGLWIVGAQPTRFAARLGRNTRVVERLPRAFGPGKGMRLGEHPLTPFCNDVDAMLQAQCGLVTIRIALDPATRDVVRPIVESLLAMFVPAHCRIDLRIGAAGRTAQGGRLDTGWRLADDDGSETPGTARLDDPSRIELGAETALGNWRLPSRCPPPFTIDGTAALDGARRLA